MLSLSISVNVNIITLNQIKFLKFTIFSRQRRVFQCSGFSRDELYKYCKYSSVQIALNAFIDPVLLFYSTGKIEISLHISITNKL